MVKIPTKLEDIVPPAALGKILDVLNQPAISGAVREALHRVGLKDASPVDQVQEAWQQAREWVGQFAHRFSQTGSSNPLVINATGELLRSDSSGLPMPACVAEAFAAQAVNFHDRARLEDSCQHAATQLLDSDEAICTSSLTAAIQALCGSFRQCVVSRADTVRIPGFGDLRAMLALQGELIEVGATNGASTDDWSAVVTGADQALVLVSPNSLTSSDAAAQRAAALSVARATGAAVIEVLIDGVCSQVLRETTFQFPHIRSHLQSGIAAVVFPLDGFLGGPSGACIAGDARLLKKVRASVNAHSWNLRGAAVAATTAAFDRATQTSPLDLAVIDLLATNIANLRDRAKRLAIQVTDTEHVATAEVVERTVPLGPSPWNRYAGPSIALALTPKSDRETLATLLRSRPTGPAVHCALSDQGMFVDLRFVLPKDDHQIAQALTTSVPSQESPIEEPKI